MTSEVTRVQQKFQRHLSNQYLYYNLLKQIIARMKTVRQTFDFDMTTTPHGTI